MSGTWLRSYTLLGKVPVPCLNTLAWGRWMEQNHLNRHVGDDYLEATLDGEKLTIRVSTVFLGLDHDHFGQGPPLLFETMIFGGPHSGDMDRYTTWDEAEAGHRGMLAREAKWFDGIADSGATGGTLPAAGSSAECPAAAGDGETDSA